jgi:hypothetical protein
LQKLEPDDVSDLEKLINEFLSSWNNIKDLTN